MELGIEHGMLVNSTNTIEEIDLGNSMPTPVAKRGQPKKRSASGSHRG